MLVKPKSKDPIDRKTGSIYWYQCGELACNEEYIGLTSRDLCTKIQGVPEGSLTHPCTQHPGRTQHHPWKLQHYRGGGPWPSQNYQGAVYIRGNNPTLNRNVGKYNLHHIWNRVLFNTPDPNINSDNGHAHRNIPQWACSVHSSQ